MSFLTPLFLLGGLAIALPVIYHLIRRTTRDKVTFSSLMFLQPSPPRVTRRSRLENLFLLLLRCAVLCLLALGFARPFLQSATTADPQSGLGAQRVVLVDVSASMKRQALWDQAREKAAEWIGKAEPEDHLAVMTFGRQSRMRVSFDQWSATPVADRIPMALQSLEDESLPGWTGTHMGRALITALEALEALDIPQHAGHRQIILISDMQEGANPAGLQGFQWPEDVEIVLEPVKPDRPTNAGLAILPSLFEMAYGGARTNLRVRVLNASESAEEQFELQWMRRDGEAIPGTRQDVYVPPGQSRIIKVPVPTNQTTLSHLRLSNDGSTFDNQAYHVSRGNVTQSILYLGKPAPNDPKQLHFFLDRAFPDLPGQSITIAAFDNGQLPPPELVESTTLMVLGGQPDASRVALARDFLADGKTVLLVLQTAEDAAGIGSLLERDPPVAREARVEDYAMLSHLDFSHAILRPFADPRFSDFTKIHVWKHRQLETNNLPDANVVMAYDSGDPALLEFTRDRGSFFVLTTGWQPEDSQLALSSKFVPLMFSLLELSGGLVTRRHAYEVGDPIAIPDLDDDRAAITVTQPDGEEMTWEPNTPFPDATAPGIYQLALPDGPLGLAVNLAPDESRTTPMEPDMFESLGLPLNVATTTSAETIEERHRNLRASELENRQKLWRWLILAALVFLLAETWLGGRLSRSAT